MTRANNRKLENRDKAIKMKSMGVRKYLKLIPVVAGVDSFRESIYNNRVLFLSFFSFHPQFVTNKLFVLLIGVVDSILMIHTGLLVVTS